MAKKKIRVEYVVGGESIPVNLDEGATLADLIRAVGGSRAADYHVYGDSSPSSSHARELHDKDTVSLRRS